MIKLLVISGPTATGKTKLALNLAKKFNGEIVSADSRQVYKYMDIGTGKDLPKKFKVQSSKFKVKKRKTPYYTNGKIKIWGLDLVEPDEEFSVNDYIKFAIPVIKDIHKRGKLPIVVGGAGLYIRALLDPIGTINIPQNKKLREELDVLSVSQLQDKLKQANNARFKKMNHSDQNNPRRLIRAIEITNFPEIKDKSKKKLLNSPRTLNKEIDFLFICLTAPLSILYKHIDDRVERRVKQGVLDEVSALLRLRYTWNMPSMSGMGYKEFKKFFISSKFKAFDSSSGREFQSSKFDQELKEEIIQKWKINEKKYAKRQLTWFKKQDGVHWFDIARELWKKDVVDLVSRWYTKNNNQIPNHK